jgi:hypothetical protein
MSTLFHGMRRLQSLIMGRWPVMIVHPCPPPFPRQPKTLTRVVITGDTDPDPDPGPDGIFSI